jgi:hypothetical protein
MEYTIAVFLNEGQFVIFQCVKYRAGNESSVYNVGLCSKTISVFILLLIEFEKESYPHYATVWYGVCFQIYDFGTLRAYSYFPEDSSHVVSFREMVFVNG